MLREIILLQENTMKLDLSPHTVHKNQSRWIKHILVNVTIIRPLKENMGEYLYIIRLGDVILRHKKH